MATYNLSNIFLLLVLFLFEAQASVQEDVPYEPRDNFGFELDYTFKTRPPPDSEKVYLAENRSVRGSQVLPYLKLRFEFSSFDATYFRYKVENHVGSVIKSRKLKFPDSYVLDMGFSDDVKDRVTPHQYTIYFYNKTKEPISKIAIEVAENGDLLLNGEFHGRI
ncbi:MAG: hypothetical protein AAF149_10715 [Bacteroidota bacterium]